MSIKIKNGSSMYKLLTWWDIGMLPNNFCELLWCTLKHLAILSFICTLVGAFLGDLLAGIVASVVVGSVVWSLSLTLLTGLVVLTAIVFGFAGLRYLFSSAIEEKPEGLLANTVEAYKGFKDKYCPIVEETE